MHLRYLVAAVVLANALTGTSLVHADETSVAQAMPTSEKAHSVEQPETPTNGESGQLGFDTDVHYLVLADLSSRLDEVDPADFIGEIYYGPAE